MFPSHHNVSGIGINNSPSRFHFETPLRLDSKRCKKLVGLLTGCLILDVSSPSKKMKPFLHHHNILTDCQTLLYPAGQDLFVLRNKYSLELLQCARENPSICSRQVPVKKRIKYSKILGEQAL